MYKKNIVRSVALAGAIFCMTGFAIAGAAIVTPTLTGTENTTAGIGLRFEFGDNTAQIVASLRHTYTNTNNTVTGAMAEIAVPLFPAAHFGPKIRAMGLLGSTSFQGEAGVGYDFYNQQPLIGLGVQGPYVEAGANYLFDGKFHPYLGVDTYGGAPGASTVLVKTPIIIGQ